MEPRKSSASGRHSARAIVLKTLRAAHGGPVRVADIRDVTPEAAARALSRLTQRGVILKVCKGIYYVPRETLLGKSLPSEAAIIQKLLPRRIRPTGITAANLLGMSTQMAAQPEYVAYASARPRGTGFARIHLRPQRHEEELEPMDAALLEFLRDRGRYGELNPGDTCARARAILLEHPGPVGELLEPDSFDLNRLQRLRGVALGEPPRVRAILGALMQSAGLPEGLWSPLRASLNPLSRFDFGPFRELSQAKEWQAK